MTILVSLAIAFLFATGAYLMLKRDLIRLIAGMMLIGNAANLFIMASGLRRGVTPILPLDERASDPLVQAMVLTAIVISFAVGALALLILWFGGVVMAVLDGTEPENQERQRYHAVTTSPSASRWRLPSVSSSASSLNSPPAASSCSDCCSSAAEMRERSTE
jgi:multicomponent Na+:H+ antiporter subunit C